MSHFSEHIDIQLPYFSEYKHLSKQAQNEDVYLYKELIKILVRNKALTENEISIAEFAAGDGLFSLMLIDYLSFQKKTHLKYHFIELDETKRHSFTEMLQNLPFNNIFFVESDFPKMKSNIQISIHACDTLTDKLIKNATSQKADFILAKPCCYHSFLNENKAFFDRYPLHFQKKLAAIYTDIHRIAYLQQNQYNTQIIDAPFALHQPPDSILFANKQSNIPQNKTIIIPQNTRYKFKYPYLED